MSRWPVNKAYPWEVAPFFRILLPFAAGIFCYYKSWLVAISGFWLSWVSVFFFLLLVIAVSQKTSRANAAFTFALTNLFLLAAGFSIAFYNDAGNKKTWFGNSISASRTYVARIGATPVEKENSWKLQVSVISAIDTTGVKPVSGQAFVYMEKGDGPLQLHKGDTLLLPGKWVPLRDAGNPFEFSYATYSARNNILQSQWCTESEISSYGVADPAAMPFAERAHDWCMAQLGKYLSGHDAMGLIQAMLLGDEVNLDPELRETYTNTGIIHIVAISGGNIAIFFVAISFILGWIKHRKYLWVKYAVALPAIWFYVLMAGAQPSAVRAAVMFSILAFGIMLQKKSNGINQLLATAFVLLCAEPAWLFSIGFQLSFIAVLSILLFYKRVYSLIPVQVWKDAAKGKSRIVFHILTMQWSVLSMSIAAELLIAPIVIYYFHLYPLMFAIANVAAFMFMSITLLSGMVLVIVSPISLFATPIATFVKALVSAFTIIVGLLQGAGPRSFRYLMLTGYETILLYMLIAGIACWLLLTYKRGLLLGLSAACLLFCSLCFSEWTRLHQRKLAFYSIPHASHVELIEGCNYAVINTDPTFDKKIGYATRPAHISWRAWQELRRDKQELFMINGKSVLLLNQKVISEQRFPVDYLILNYPGKPDINYLVRIFSPSVVVAGNNYSRMQLDKIIKDGRQAGVSVHTLAGNGAFVLSN